jgi:hypothetical protein
LEYAIKKVQENEGRVAAEWHESGTDTCWQRISLELYLGET